MLLKSKRRIINVVLTYLICLVAVFFFISPILWMTYTSFRTTDAIFSGKVLTPARQFTLKNYEIVLSVTDFPIYFWNSIRIGFAVTLLSMVISIVGAYGLSRYPLQGRNVYIMGVFSTQMFPVVLLLIPIYQVLFAIGLFNTILGVVFGQLMLVLPFSVWMLKGYFDKLPKDVEDSARIDGSQSQRTATVTLALQRLGSALILRWGQVAAATVLTVIPTIILFWFAQTRLVEGLTAGAVKS
jgi:multiple sugar transport system permease protein